MIENVSGELKKYFEGKPIVSALLSLDMIILYVAAGLMVLNRIVSIGTFVSALLLYVLVFGAVLCLANNNFSAIMIGLGVKAGVDLVSLVISIFGRYRAFSWSSLYSAIIFAFFAYMAYKKTFAKE